MLFFVTFGRGTALISCKLNYTMQSKEERFNTILADNKERIRRICCYYVPNIEDQNDIYQEILVNIWKSLDNFRGDSAISTWIYRIAVNTSLNFAGKALKQMKLMVSADTMNLGSLLDSDEVADKAIKEQQIEHLQAELNTLSVIDKMLISLTLEGLSMREISDIVGITEPNVKVKIHRIKHELKTKLIGG